MNSWRPDNSLYSFSNCPEGEVSSYSQGKLVPFFNLGNTSTSFPTGSPTLKRFTCQVSALSAHEDVTLLDFNTEDLYRLPEGKSYPLYEREYGTSSIDPVKGIPVRFQKIEYCGPTQSGYFYALAGNPVEYKGVNAEISSPTSRDFEDAASTTQWGIESGIQLTAGCDYINNFSATCPISGSIDNGTLHLGLSATFQPFPVPGSGSDGKGTIDTDGSTAKSIWAYPGIENKTTNFTGDGYCEYQFTLKKLQGYDDCISVYETEDTLQIQNNYKTYLNSNLICSESDVSCAQTYNFYDLQAGTGITFDKESDTCTWKINLNTGDLPFNFNITGGNCISTYDLGDGLTQINNDMTISSAYGTKVTKQDLNPEDSQTSECDYSLEVTGSNGYGAGLWDRCYDNENNIFYNDGKVIVGTADCSSVLSSPSSVLNVFGNIHLKELLVDNVGEDASSFNAGSEGGGSYPVLTVTGSLLKWDAWQVKKITLCEGDTTTDYQILVKPLS